MVEQTFLNNQLLIAMPHLTDPNFARTVTYICEHNENGAMGIIINRPLEIKLGDIFKQMNIVSVSPTINQAPILAGGPVGQEQGFIIHEPTKVWKGTHVASEHLAITTSRDILEAIAVGDGPEKSLVSLGYAGWGAGQLEQELINNYWINAPVIPDIIFDKPFAERWLAATSSIGLNITHLSDYVGHG